MYEMKKIAEDFKVDELTNVEPDKGDYCYFWMTKKNYTTVDAIRKVAEALRIPKKRFGFAGSKDKKAVTKQLCSGYNVKKEDLERLKLKDIELEFFGGGDKPISLGDLKGNKFSIVVRNLDEFTVDNIAVVNYFDEQRFSENNVEIGKALVNRDLQRAVELVSQGRGDYNKKVREYILESKNDFVGALKQIEKKILMIFVHSYQSWLWNEVASEYVRLNSKEIKEVDYSLGKFVFPIELIEDVKIPVIGFGTEFKNKEIEKIAVELLMRETVVLRDFIIRQIPELTAEGVERDLIVSVKDFEYNIGVDELNEGKKKAIVSFVLSKGSYATIVIKALVQ